MEEKKEKKKFNKKPLLICLAIALVLAVIGFIDIKSNAAEKYTVNVTFDRTTGTENKATNVITFYSTSPMQVYVYTSHDVPASQTEKIWGYAFVVSDSKIDDGGSISSVKYTKNGKDFYVMMHNLSYGPYDFQPNQYFNVYSDVGKDIRLKTQYATAYDFAQAYINDSLDVVIDYNNLPIDDEMPVPEKVKYNIVVDNKSGAINDKLSAEVYDILSWSNTSSVYSLQLDSVPIVQYRKTKLNLNSYGVVHDDSLIKEFSGDWKTENIFSEVTNTFSKYSKGVNLALNDIDAYRFKKYCDDTYEWNVVTEESNLVFGYRLRYIDFDNEKAGPWVYLMPNSKEYSYNSYIVYSDDSTGNSENANGVVNEYTDLDNIDNAVNDIVTENEFKDKYDDINSDVDTQDVTNWLYAVTDFIKSTPQVIGSVLGFLPKPILYGMYVCIYLGVIASGVAIVKALI